MARRTFTSFLFAAALPATALFAQQPPPPLPPAVGNAVLLATHSIQVDRDCTVTRGDLVVNDAGAAPFLGEKELSLDQGVHTPAGFAVKANGVDIDGGAVVGGAVHYNSLRNDGTILGPLVTPLALPVIDTLPALPSHPAGTQNITVENGRVQPLGTGDYGALAVGRDATLRLGGGPYAFSSITTERGASIIFDGPGELFVNGSIVLAQSTTIGAAPDITTKHKMIFASGAVTIGKDSAIAATVCAPNGTIDAAGTLSLTGSFVARDIHIGRDSTLTLRSGFRNLPPVAFNQTITLTSIDPVVITLTGSDPDLDPLHFSIDIPPTFGTLGPVLPAGPTSAVVVYSPRDERVNDVFTFRVTDSEGFTATGVVTINQGIPLPPPPRGIVAQPATIEVPSERPSLLSLNAIAPEGVAVTISIVPGTGPSFGNLGPIMQPQLDPPRPAEVPYAPQHGFVGEDSFQFRACGTIDGVQTCDVALIRIAVIGPEIGELAPDRQETVTSGASQPITLATSTAPATYRILALPANGTLKDSNGTLITEVPYALPSGLVTYTSTSGFTGTDTFQYEVTSGGPQPVTDAGVVTITVTPPPPPDTGGELAPDITISATGGVAATFSLQPTGGATTYRVLTLPANGTLIDSNGNRITAAPYTLPTYNLTYQSSSTFTGAVSFTYEVVSGQQTDTGVVTINVAPAPDNGR
jgi:hypothetical protein